jgi:hypothetical protein
LRWQYYKTELPTEVLHASTPSFKKMRRSDGGLVLRPFSFYGILVSVSQSAGGESMARINMVLHRACIAVTAALVLTSAGCATSNVNVASYFGGGPPKPTTIVVSEFEIAPGAVSVERGLAPAYRRKLGKTTPDQLKAELATAVNEAVADAMVAALVDGGLPATVGTGETANSTDPTVIVTGRIHKVDDKDRMKRRLSGLPPSHDTVTAEVQVSQQAGGARKELLAFGGETDSASKPGATASAAASTPATTASTGASEKLTAGVAAEARRIGNASASRILAFAAEQGWISK